MSPVRNISAIGSTKPIPIYVWISPSYNPIYKIELYDGTTTYDVTDIVIEGEYTWGVTETIGKFEFVIDNSAQTYLTTFSPYNEIRVYLDYGTSATNLRFKGIIERVSKRDFKLVVTGRGPATKYVGKNITYSVSDTARSTILTNIITKYFNSSGTAYTGQALTTTNLGSDTTTATVNYYEKPFWEVVEDICGQASYGAYIDSDFDFHYFAESSVRNSVEASVHDYNLIETGDFAPDASNVYNKVVVYGAEEDTIPLLATEENDSSQKSYGVRELKIVDTNIITAAQAKARAQYELSQNKDPPTVGRILSLGLPTLAPGEQLRISDPLNGLNPGYYDVFEFTHRFSNDAPFMTEVTIKKERSTIPKILKKRIKFESEISQVSNPNEMTYSVVYDFDTDVGSHSSTEITGGVLQLTSGNTSGIWESPVTTTTKAISGLEVRAAADPSLADVKIYVSADGGANYYQVVGTGTQRVLAGNNLKVRVSLGAAAVKIKTLGILYKT